MSSKTVVAPIYIHAGAHRTGTSSFQMCLFQNAGLLRRLGFDLAYPSRDGVPDGTLRLKLPPPRVGMRKARGFAPAIRAELLRHNRDPSRALVLSEENLPGRMFHFQAGRFFPAAQKRLRALADALADRPRELLYVIRPYDALYMSAYRKRAEDNPVPDFQTLVPAFLGMDRGWPELLELMQQTLRPQRMVVLRHQNRGESRDLLVHLIPELAAEALLEPSETLNKSASDAALAVLQARYRAGVSLDRAAWQAVIAEEADQQAPEPFAVFSAADAITLQQRYEADLARIATMPGLTLV